MISVSWKPPPLRDAADSVEMDVTRKVVVVTTAAPPWRTGTAVNPTLRAAYLSRLGFDVCLLLPWLTNLEAGRALYSGMVFQTLDEHEKYVREWIREYVPFEYKGHIAFYDAVYESGIESIIQAPASNLIDAIPASHRDIAILEEPDHLNWLHEGPSWSDVFGYVVGIVHTNYEYYANKGGTYGLKSRLVPLWDTILRNAYTDINIHLSKSTLKTQSDACSFVASVHGVRDHFFRSHEDAADRVYFLGKAVWNKGYDLLIELCADLGDAMPRIDAYGSGPDWDEIDAAIRSHQAPVTLRDGVEHSPETMASYRTFFNPSKSEVLCTATAEALAMGKYAILPVHASNEFFYAFSNCLLYATADELEQAFRRASAEPPKPISEWEARRLSWSEATKRLVALLDTSSIRTDGPGRSVVRAGCRGVHRLFLTQPLQSVMRKAMGVTPLSFAEGGASNLIVKSAVVGTVVLLMIMWGYHGTRVSHNGCKARR